MRCTSPHRILLHPTCAVAPRQAREYLYWQLTGRQVTTPVAIMTSDAKGNHDRVSRLLADMGWAGRGQAAFRLFRQPMVPVVAVEDGRWVRVCGLKEARG